MCAAHKTHLERELSQLGARKVGLRELVALCEPHEAGRRVPVVTQERSQGETGGGARQHARHAA